MADKRTFQRKKRRLLVSFDVDGQTVKGFTLDVSHTGLLISSFHLPAPGTRLQVTLQPAAGQTVTCAGRVVRERRLPAALAQGTGSVFGFALEGYFEGYARMVSAME